MSAKATVVPEVGTVWRGFSHFWTYNHRMNRLGDFVKTNGKYECAGKEHSLNQPISIHTAASGSGEDKAHFTSYFSVIKTHNLKFIERIEIIDLEGEEKEKISKNIAVEVKLDGDRSFHEKDYSVLLNGFDLLADDSNAKKPIQLVIAVREVSLNESKNTLSFKLHVEFEAACSSFECWSDGKKVNYKFIVYYNVIYCESGLNKITKSLSRRVVWAKENLLSIPEDDQYSKMELNEDEIQGKGDNLFDQAFLGIRGFNFKMSNEFHYLKWCQFVTPKNYNSKTGNFNFHFGLHYQTWEKGMKHYVAGTDVTYSSAGFAELQMEITLIQFSSNSTSKVFNSSRSGTIHWEGGGKSAKGCEAMNCFIIE